MIAVARIGGFYAVLDREDEALARALVSASRVLQVRVKPSHAADLVRIAKLARRICDEVGATLIVNDRVDVAMTVRAEGVHLGQTDLPIEAARALVGDRMWIGISTHNLAQVERAVAAGADYLGFGPIFETRTKVDPDPVQGLAGLRVAVAAARGVPIVAIGGITPAHANEIYAAGAAGVCAISAVNRAPDVVAAARSLGRVVS